ncbi:hypothetical protein NDI56_04605 [Haloarcula sp. S1CR25-12]|uniref:DUF8168 domain-containing protein n=1 Tax=Haloarcula saliterrae TaxID=2950534 RepID=A0ABU2F8T3_9EURY|nr:hypothetical protein [Haloarcula sp. S1CR25-12]MDS0258690.1 hypothetical protein [Haloarcula sp. S1CR25-12]
MTSDVPFESPHEGPESDVDPMVAAFRHDVHKLRGRSHDAAQEVFRDARVNESVPLGADGDAARLSRPKGAPDETVANHQSPRRLSLVTGGTAVASDRIRASDDAPLDWLVLSTDPEVLHSRWLTSEAAAAYNESVYYPYTSLRFHVLLVAALLDNYRAGHEFADLHLVATPSGPLPDEGRTAAAARGSDAVEPFRTVLWSPVMSLHVTGEPGDRPSAPLGSCPARSFADTWSRLSAHPFDQSCRRWRRLDAQLRRVRSWSTALAYIEDYVAVYGDGDAR